MQVRRRLRSSFRQVRDSLDFKEVPLMINRITQLAEEITAKVIDIRHDIHQHPELGLEEYRTAGIIEKFLDDINVPHKRCGGTGIVAVIGSGEGHVVALRADMDALQMPETSGLPYASVNENIAHACGHDGHVAMLLGTAWVLKQLEHELEGTVKLLFQPAEEKGVGAPEMLENGAFDEPSPEAIYALHGWPDFPPGKVGIRFGAMLASTVSFEIVVKGEGTHGALPHIGIDPITIAAQIIEGIQHIRTRMISPLEPIVITIGKIRGGSASNVIPDKVTMNGTMRSLNSETRQKVLDMMERMITGTAQASGGNAVVNILGIFPATTNDTHATELAKDVVTEMLGPENVVEVQEPCMGGEDFSYFLERIPGSFIMLGVGDAYPPHNESFDFNDESIPVGIRIMSGIALEFLRRGLG